MWAIAKVNYVNKVSGARMFTEGKQYEIIKKNNKTNQCTVKRNDNGKRCMVSQDLFEMID